MAHAPSDQARAGSVRGHVAERTGSARRTLDAAAASGDVDQRPGHGEPAVERHEVIVVGGGQAGLATSHHLSRRGIEHVVLDAESHVGDAWRARWDSLSLFTPASIDGLPGMPFPAPPRSLPTKDEMADYLTEYAARNRVPVRSGVRVDALERTDDGYALTAGERRFGAREVVVAGGFLSVPSVPGFASLLGPSTAQVHSASYRNPSSLPGRSALLVGAGNSGVEIGLELAHAGRAVTLAGRAAFLPRALRAGGGRLFFGFARRAMTLQTPLGRRMRDGMGAHGSAPVIRVRAADLERARVQRVGRLAGVRDGSPLLDDGRVLDVDAVVWCTGFRPAFEWIRLPVLGPGGLPRHDRGVVAAAPGLSFVGLPFQTGFLSPLVGGVGADAGEIVDGIAARLGVPARRSR
jgi:putative flavoprotein involved in K+ transport